MSEEFVPAAQIGEEVRCLRSLCQLLRSERKLDVCGVCASFSDRLISANVWDRVFV